MDSEDRATSYSSLGHPPGPYTGTDPATVLQNLARKQEQCSQVHSKLASPDQSYAYGQIDPCMAKFSPLPASGICPEGLSHAQGVGRAKYPLCNQWFVCSSNTRCPERSPGGRAEQSPESKGGYNGEEITAGQNTFQMLQRPKWVPKTCKEQNGSQSPQKPKWVPKAATTQ